MAESNQENVLLPFQVGPYWFCIDASKGEAIIERPELKSLPVEEDSDEGVFPDHDKVAKVIIGDSFTYMILAEVSRIKDLDLIYPGDKIHIIMKN